MLRAMTIVPTFPPSLPPNTLVGRLAAGAGPAESIPFAALGIGGSGGGGLVFSSRTAAAAAIIPGSAQSVETAGYSAVGDGGGALYIHAGGSTNGGFQSADGQWWKLVINDFVDVKWFGADPTATVDSTAAFNAAINLASTVVVDEPGGFPYVKAWGNYKLTPPLTFSPGGPQPITIRASGAWYLSSTWTQGDYLQVIGEGGFEGNQFSSNEHYLQVNGPGGGLDTWRIHSLAHHYVSNVQIEVPSDGGIGFHFDGSTELGALATIDNVCVNSLSTTKPAFQISNFFWVWMKRCRALSASPKALYITNLAPGGGGASGLIYVTDFIYSNGGIYIDAGNNVNFNGNMFFRELTQENSTTSAVTLDGTAAEGIQGITIDGFTGADPVSGPTGLLIKGGVSNVRLLGVNDLKGDINFAPGTGATLNGLYMDGGPDGFLFSNTVWPKNLTGFSADYILGSLLSIGDTLAPAVLPFAPATLTLPNAGGDGQDAANWNAEAVAAGGNVTIAYGKLAPDGTYTAAMITSTSGLQSISFDATSYTPAVGDMIVWGGWLQHVSGNDLFDQAAFDLVWDSSSVIFNNGQHFLTAFDMGWSYNTGYGHPLLRNSDTAWLPLAGVAKITAVPGGAHTLTFKNIVNAGAPNTVWKPFYYYIPNGTCSYDEAIRFSQSLRRGMAGGRAGDVALYPHHFLKLGGGARIDSAAAQPVKKVYTSGDHTLDSSKATDGWLCITSGGAFSTTRANTTAYATGVWAAWPTGTTVWECTVAGTSTNPAPSIVGKGVGDTVVDGTVTWTMRSLTQASFINTVGHPAGAPVSITAATYTVLATDYQLVANFAGTVTLTLGTPTYGRELWVKTITNNTVVSASSNVVPAAGGAAGTAILPNTAGKWARLMWDGSNWNIEAFGG
jgi:hypothetical protein